MTHEALLKINELFDNKIISYYRNIKVSLILLAKLEDNEVYKAINFLLKKLGIEYTNRYSSLEEFYKTIKYSKIHLKDNISNIIKDSKYDKQLPLLLKIIDIFSKIKEDKLSFSGRRRYGEAISIEEFSPNKIEIKTGEYTIEEIYKFYLNLFKPLIEAKLINVDTSSIKISRIQIAKYIYNNIKNITSNLNSKKVSSFAIACYLYLNNKTTYHYNPLYKWDNINFFKGILHSKIWEENATEDMKNIIQNHKDYWTVVSEISFLTSKSTNVNKTRRIANDIINECMNKAGYSYLEDIAYRLRLGEIDTPSQNLEISLNKMNQSLANTLKDNLTKLYIKVPTNEELIDSIKRVVLLARIKDIDFSSKRKDHLILDKDSRERIFSIL